MREILFRGKRVDNGEWIEGSLIKTCGLCLIFSDTTKECCVVLNDTVGQFTGMLDRNGKKIFEGDLIQFGIVRDVGCYPHTETGFTEVKCKNGVFNPFHICVPDTNLITVIGCIHDPQHAAKKEN